MVSAASYDCHVESVDDLSTYVHVMDLWIMYSALYSLCGTINFIMFMVCARARRQRMYLAYGLITGSKST